MLSNKTVDKDQPGDSVVLSNEAGDKEQPCKTPLLKYVRQPAYLLHVMWFSISELRWYTFMGFLNAWLFDVTANDLTQGMLHLPCDKYEV